MKPISEHIYGHSRSHTCTITRTKLHEYLLEIIGNRFYRSGGLPDNQKGIGFIDPSGGPFIAVGTPLREYSKRLPNTKIKAIVRKDNHYYLQTEPNKRLKKTL